MNRCVSNVAIRKMVYRFFVCVLLSSFNHTKSLWIIVLQTAAEAAAVDTRSTIRETMIVSIATLTVTSVDTIQQVSAALTAVTSAPAEISRTSQVIYLCHTIQINVCLIENSVYSSGMKFQVKFPVVTVRLVYRIIMISQFS